MFVLIVYFPVGLLLAVLRMFIGLQAFVAACVLPKSSVLRRFVSHFYRAMHFIFYWNAVV